VWSHISNKFLSPGITRHGYYIVVLVNDTGKYTKTVHRLVANAYIPNPQNKHDINHIDANKTNNDIDNLEWVTRIENCAHAAKLDLYEPQRAATSKGVKQLDPKTLEVITVHRSATAAAIALGKPGSRAHIGRCCKDSNKTAGGFKWQYA
jgi:hypothetical protein